MNYAWVRANYPEMDEPQLAITSAGQGLLFDFLDAGVSADEDLPEEDAVRILTKGKRCGTCASMDTSLPGCATGECGRCIDPKGRSYYLRPENTRANEWLPDGDPEKYPEGGSWAYVARDSCACEKYRAKARCTV